ncbi:N-acetyltransferase family protein [Clostridium sp.]|uniref:GNAT family N-acetyltransferase n=1 Tax=Clostridium sp. TaxID=1506 RepID=UPI003D6CD7D1
MLIKVLTKVNATQFWDLRLKGLRENPEAFGASYEEELNIPINNLILKFNTEFIGPLEDNFILGAFDENNDLVGMIGLRRERRSKMKHKASLWGMYVVSQLRQTGIGRLLLVELISKAKSIQGLEQISLGVVSSNQKAKGLYASIGFQICGLEKNALKIGQTYFDEDLMVYFIK